MVQRSVIDTNSEAAYVEFTRVTYVAGHSVDHDPAIRGKWSLPRLMTRSPVVLKTSSIEGRTTASAKRLVE
jgi:hypothetical protein